MVGKPVDLCWPSSQFACGNEPSCNAADIDESSWAQLYSTISRAFDPPATGKIAVKVINHYGDEVLKVFDVA